MTMVIDKSPSFFILPLLSSELLQCSIDVDLFSSIRLFYVYYTFNRIPKEIKNVEIKRRTILHYRCLVLSSVVSF